jgi:hypothetical protein
VQKNRVARQLKAALNGPAAAAKLRHQARISEVRSSRGTSECDSFIRPARALSIQHSLLVWLVGFVQLFRIAPRAGDAGNSISGMPGRSALC